MRASIIFVTLLLCGCSAVSTYRRYERPPLFHPTTAKIKETLTSGASGGQNLVGSTQSPTKPLEQSTDHSAGTSAPITIVYPPEIRAKDRGNAHDIRVMDTCTGDSVPQITAYPPTALSGPLKKDAVPGWFATSLKLDGTSDYVGDVDVIVRSCDSAKPEHRFTVPVAYEQITTTFNLWATADVAEEFGEEFSRTFIVADVVFENPNESSLLIYGSSLAAEVRFLAAEEDVEKAFGKKALDSPSLLDSVRWGDRPVSQALDFKDRYRPLAYSDVLAIFSNRKESDPRQRTISGLRSLGELAAGAAVFITAADYARGVSLFSGILVPELEKQLLWDVLLHLKNIEQRSLKEVEEVPARGQLRRAVFFPMRAIPAILPPFPMYVAEIRPDEMPVTAVLIEKKATVSSK